MNIQPRFIFDKPVHNFEVLKPRLLRAAFAALANTDELIWKGSTSVGFQGIINFQVTFHPGFKKPRAANPFEIFKALNDRAEKFHTDDPEIVMTRAKLNELKNKNDLVNFMDYLDDYSEAINESKEDRNKYFYGLYVKIVNSLKHVEMPLIGDFRVINYNSASVIRQARLSKKLDAIWCNFEKIKPYLPIDVSASIASNLKTINYLIIEFPQTESLDQSIDAIEPLMKDSLNQKTVDNLYRQAEEVVKNRIHLVELRSRLLLEDISERTMRFRLALIYIDCLNKAESSKIEPHTKINIRNNFAFRLNRLNLLLSFLSIHLDKYPASIDTESVDRIARLENLLTIDPDVVHTFQRFVSRFVKDRHMDPRAHSAQASLMLNLKRNSPLDAYANIITLYNRLT